METICRGGRAVHGFALGSVLGLYTVDDIDKLIKNKDVDLASLGAQVAKSSDAGLQADWAALSRTYGAARAKAIQVMADVRRYAITPDSLNANADTDAAYKDVVVALQGGRPFGQEPPPGQTTKGSVADIAGRLTAAGIPIPPVKLPFPLEADADSSFYRHTDPSNLPTPGDLLAWLRDHETALVVGGVVLVGGVALIALSPYVRLLAAAVPRRRAT
jgi:hypothetical protein